MERRGEKEGRERRKMRKDEEREKKYEGSGRVEEGWRKSGAVAWRVLVSWVDWDCVFGDLVIW